TFTIFCTMRGSHDGEWLQHCDRHGYVEPTGGSFGASVDCSELTGPGSLCPARRGLGPRRRAYPVDAKDTGLRSVGFKSSGKTKIIAPAFMAIILMTWATSSSFRPDTDCPRAICRESPHHTDALGCLIGKRASFITPSTLAH